MKEKQDLPQENFPMRPDELDKEIHDTLVEMGWVIPQTEEDVGRAQAALEGAGCRQMPAELSDPYRLMSRLDDSEVSNAPLRGILSAAKEKGMSVKQLAALTKLTVVLVVMLDRGMISVRRLPRLVVERVAAAIGATAEGVIEYLSAGPRLAGDARFKAEESPRLEEPQEFADAVRDDPTMSLELREHLLSLPVDDV